MFIQTNSGKTINALATFGLALFLILSGAHTSLAADWATFQNDNFNSGITEDRGPITLPEPDVSWDRQIGYITSESLVVGDILYVITSNSAVTALNRSTGDIIWNTATGKYNLAAATYGNDILFVPMSQNGLVYAFNATDGTILWNKKIGSDYAQMNTPITYEDHRIYFGEMYGDPSSRFFCYHENGTQIWNRSSTSGEGYYRTSPSIVGEYLIYGDHGANLTSVFKNNGTTIDEIDLPAEFGLEEQTMRTSATYYPKNRRIYTTSEAGYCFAIGLESDGTFNMTDMTVSDQVERSSSSPAIYNGRVYFGTGNSHIDGKLYCLNASTLDHIWDYTPIDGGIQSSPAISTYYDDGDGEIYLYFTANCQEGSAYCLKDITGNTEPIEQWNYTPPEEKNQFNIDGISISQGRVYFGNDEVGSDGGYIFSLATAQSVSSGDWNPWNDILSENGEAISTTELQAAINCWVTETPAPGTGGEVTTVRLQQLINDWIQS